VRHGSVDRGGQEWAAFLADPPRPRNGGIHAPNQHQATSHWPARP
jgi:hypothetical protein